MRPGGGGVRLGVPGVSPMVRRIMLVSGGIWLLQFLLAVTVGSNHLAHYFGVSASGVLSGMIWQPVTYIFLHAPRAPFHIVFNMLMLWMFGGELERHWGGTAFLRYYVVCGVGGGIFAVILGLVAGPAAYYTTTIGASGSIFGLIVAYGMIFSERVILFMMIFPMKARTMAMILFGLQVFYLFGQTQSGVSYIGHLGGAITGFLYLKRAWRFGDFYRELKWKYQRRKFKVIPPKDDDNDRWVN